jgi:SAM-dependent methyltransferase
MNINHTEDTIILDNNRPPFLLRWINSFDPRYRFINLVPYKAKALDLGCGNFRTLDKLRQYRPDIQWSAVDRIKDFTNVPQYVNYQCVNLDSDNLPFQIGGFDVVFVSHVLEHLLNPLHVISEISRVLNKGGMIYVEVPSLISLFVPSFSFLISEGATLNFFDDYTHQKPYTKKAVQDFLKACSCDVVRVRSVRNPLKFLASPILFLVGLFTWNRRLVSIAIWEMTGWANYGIGRKK